MPGLVLVERSSFVASPLASALLVPWRPGDPGCRATSGGPGARAGARRREAAWPPFPIVCRSPALALPPASGGRREGWTRGDGLAAEHAGSDLAAGVARRLTGSRARGAGPRTLRRCTPSSGATACNQLRCNHMRRKTRSTMALFWVLAILVAIA